MSFFKCKKKKSFVMYYLLSSCFVSGAAVLLLGTLSNGRSSTGTVHLDGLRGLAPWPVASVIF